MDGSRCLASNSPGLRLHSFLKAIDAELSTVSCLESCLRSYSLVRHTHPHNDFDYLCTITYAQKSIIYGDFLPNYAFSW